MKENWSFENYLKIEVSKIIWKLNLRIGILEIKFERNWNFENYLAVGIFENYLTIRILKIKLRIRMLEIKFWKKLKFWKLSKDGIFF